MGLWFRFVVGFGFVCNWFEIVFVVIFVVIVYLLDWVLFLYIDMVGEVW